MFTIEADKTINVTRGDILYFSVMAEENGEKHFFQAGDIVRISVYGKKECENVVLQKDFPVTEITDTVEIYLVEEDTKIGEIINKQKDYWYEIVLNPDTAPQTIIGYDGDGAKVFRLYPEGEDIPATDEEVLPEEIPIIDDELNLLSNRPVRNKAITRAIINASATLNEAINKTNEKLDNSIKESEEAHNSIIETINQVADNSATERQKIADDAAAEREQIAKDLNVERERLDVVSEKVSGISAPVGEVLFEGSADGTIEFDATKHKLFAIRLKATDADCYVFCGIGKNNRNLADGNNYIVGSTTLNFYSYPDRYPTSCVSVCIQLSVTDNKHTIGIAEYNNTTDGTKTIPITQVIGIV